jgi:hypothetical protein
MAFHHVEVALMRWTIAYLACLTGCIALFPTRGADAASSFSNSLTGFTGDSTQAGTQAAVGAAGFNFFSTVGFNDNGTPADTTDDSNDTVVLDGSGAHFGSLWVGDGGRNYMRTNESDYATHSFDAQITFDAPNLQDQDTWFGLGTGDRALFGWPDWSTQFSSVMVLPQISDPPASQSLMTTMRTANDSPVFVDTAAPGLGNGTHRLRMLFDAATNLVRFSIDINYAGGPFTADIDALPVSVASLFGADGWPSEPSRIYFGGDDGVVFRDFSVTVPEPASFVLLLMGGIAVVGGRVAAVRMRK